MLQKFALAVKTKTVEFFAEEEEEEAEEGSSSTAVVDEIITGQRVVVIKPDGPIRPASSLPSPADDDNNHKLRETLVSSLFTAISSFHSAYLQLQSAHEPFNLDGIETADRTAVSHLRRLLELRKAYQDLPEVTNFDLPLTSEPDAQVQENQSMLRMLETVFNRLEFNIDRKDAKVSLLKKELREIEKSNSLLERRCDEFSAKCFVKAEKAFLSIGVFEAVVKDSWKEARRFTKVFIDQMKSSRWKMELVAKSMYPDVDFAKSRHCSYSLLSYVCLNMFSGFGSNRFGLIADDGDQEIPSGVFLGQFIEHLTVDPLEILDKMPTSTFAMFCKNKYQKIVHTKIESSLFGGLNWWDPVMRSWQPSNPLYKPFVAVCSSVWMLNKLAIGFNRPVEIFQVAPRAKFSMVNMESTVPRIGSKDTVCTDDEQKVGFTVFPGFQVGSIIIQCKVYLNYCKISL